MVDQLPTVDTDGGPREPLPVVLIAPDGSIYAAGGPVGIGQPTDAAWDGVAPSASLISIMKAVHAQLVAVNANTGT